MIDLNELTSVPHLVHLSPVNTKSDATRYTMQISNATGLDCLIAQFHRINRHSVDKVVGFGNTYPRHEY